MNHKQTCAQSHPGTYSDIISPIENDHFYYEDYNVLFFKLLPLSELQFMDPGHYNRNIQIGKKILVFFLTRIQDSGFQISTDVADYVSRSRGSK